MHVLYSTRALILSLKLIRKFIVVQFLPFEKARTID